MEKVSKGKYKYTRHDENFGSVEISFVISKFSYLAVVEVKGLGTWTMLNRACIWTCKTLFYFVSCTIYIMMFEIECDREMDGYGENNLSIRRRSMLLLVPTQLYNHSSNYLISNTNWCFNYMFFHYINSPINQIAVLICALINCSFSI